MFEDLVSYRSGRYPGTPDRTVLHLAVHEAGHALVADALGWTVVSSDVRTSPGSTRCEPDEALSSRSAVFNAACYLAGDVAEQITGLLRSDSLDRLRPSAANRQLLRRMAVREGHSDRQVIEDAMALGFTTGEADQARALAAEILTARRPALQALAAAIEYHRRLAGEELAALLPGAEARWTTPPEGIAATFGAYHVSGLVPANGNGHKEV